MLPVLQKTIASLRSAAQKAVETVAPNNRSGLTDDEQSAWDERVKDYDEWWSWHSGEAVKVLTKSKKTKEGQKAPYKWPLQLNLIALGSRIHQQALIGDTKDPADVPAPVLFDPPDEKDDDSIALAEHANKVLRQVEYENNAAAMDTEGMLLSQVYGGIVQRVTWEGESPDRLRGIKFEYFTPDEVWFRWRGTDYWNPTDAWLKRRIARVEAEKYGVQVYDDEVEYMEHWTPTSREITVDGRDAKHPTTGESLVGENPDGFVPFIYIPHIREGSMWGISLVSGALGVMEEINSRAADIGDGIYLGTHEFIFGKNMPSGSPSLRMLPDGRPFLDGGRTLGKGPEPSMEVIKRTLGSEISMKFVDFTIEMLYLQLMMTSSVVGKLEGTQRSGDTVHSLGWLMHSHVNIERINWTTGLSKRAEMVMRIAANRGLFEVEKSSLGLRKRVHWAPQAPIDREALANEITLRMNDGSLWPDLAMEKFGDVPNIAEGMSRVREWMRFQAELNKPAVPPAAGGGKPAPVVTAKGGK